MKGKAKSEKTTLSKSTGRASGKKTSGKLSNIFESETQKLIHELDVLRIELELQNDELFNSNAISQEISKKYLELYDFAPTAYFTLSKEGVIQNLNLCGAKMLGKERSELKNSSFGFFVSNNTKSAFAGFLSNIFSLKSMQTCELALLESEGAVTYIIMAGISDTGNQECYLTAIDINERKLAEEKIIKNTNQLKLALAASNSGSWDWDIISNTFYWSDELITLFGMPKDIIPGFDSWSKCLHPDDVNDATKKIQSAIDEHLDLINEYRIILPSGDLRWIRARGRTYYDLGHKPLRMIGICTDITDLKDVVHALRKSEKSLEVAQSMSHVGSWEWDMITGKVTWSKEMFILYDINPATFDNMAESILRIVHPDDVGLFKKSMNSNLEGESSPSLEYRVVHRDGSIHNILANGIVELDTSGRPVRSIGTSLDITDLVKSEAALRDSEEKYRTLFETNSDGITILQVEPDEKLTIIDMNENAYKMLGYTKEEMLYSRPDDYEIDLTAEKIELRKRALERNGYTAFETKIRHKNGQPVNIEFTVHLFKYGNRPAMMNIARNITERKKAEEKIIRSSEEWNKTFNSASDAICLLDKDNKMIRSNNAMIELVGQNFVQPNGCFCWKIIHNTDGPFADCPAEKMKKSRKKEVSIYNLHDQTYEVTVDPILNSDGTLDGAVHIMRNITERVKIEEELRKNQENLTEKMRQLERFNNLSIGRELKMVELKKEVNELLMKLGDSPKYRIVK
jgi:PAS domain S-box-containing protein